MTTSRIGILSPRVTARVCADWGLIMRVSLTFSRDNPSFLVTVLICGFFLLYSKFGVIDYFPSLEVSRILTYPLLATGMATVTLRPATRYARVGMGVAAFLSLETAYTFLLYGDLLPDFFRISSRSCLAGFYQIVRFCNPLLRGVGLSSRLTEPCVYCLLTGFVSCICGKAFVETSWLKLAILFGVAMVVAFPLAYGVEVLTDFGLSEVWFMLIHLALFWHLVVWNRNQDPAATPPGVVVS